MKTELTDVSETRKHVTFEIEPDVVDAEIARVATGYSKSARVPGFRPGKAPRQMLRTLPCTAMHMPGSCIIWTQRSPARTIVLPNLRPGSDLHDYSLHRQA